MLLEPDQILTEAVVKTVIQVLVSFIFMINKNLKVLVENLSKDKTKIFCRSEYMTPVIFNGKKDDIGKIVPVIINQSNRSTLFGELINSSNQKVA